MFLYSASLTSLPKDIYERADLDGVNGIQRFFYITLPQLKPTTFFLTVTGIISSFKVFGSINVMTHGGPRQQHLHPGVLHLQVRIYIL